MLPKSSGVSPQTLEQLQKLESQLRERDEKLSELLSGKKALDDELERLRIEVAEAKKQNANRPDDHNYSEAETRDYFIDLLLKEAGWSLANPQDREFPVTGMPNNAREGFVTMVTRWVVEMASSMALCFFFEKRALINGCTSNLIHQLTHLPASRRGSAPSR